MGILSLGCGSSNQAKQQQETTSGDTTKTEVAPVKKDTTDENDRQVEALKEKYREQLLEDYQNQANEITSFYILAQRNFFSGNYETALAQVNKALKVRENADLFALKGNIYWALDNTSKFVENWRKALSMDKDVPLPLTQSIVDALKNQDLINENLERNF